jgi:fatty acid kinase
VDTSAETDPEAAAGATAQRSRRPIELAAMLRFADRATDELAAAREEIDALNVYPVPDGDTGTNMFLTMSAGRDAIREQAARDPGADIAPAMQALARGALLGARGNSGVILSQILGAVAGRIARAGPEERAARVMAEALHEATEASYAAVGRPVEGTILTVMRAASEAAAPFAEDADARARDVFAAAGAAAREALARTPEQLTVLRDAGVVDAGGRGLCVVLDAVETVLTGRRTPVVAARLGRHQIPVPRPGEDLTEDGPAYEVMYLLDADDESVPELRATLDGQGDSLVVVGGGGLWNVHVHVDEVGPAIEAGIAAGRPHRIRVVHFAEQVAAARAKVSERRGRAVVAVAAGPGLAGLFGEAGATVIRGGPKERPSAAMFLDAVTAAAAAEVVLLPNDADSVSVAEIAARTAEQDHGVRAVVIATRTQVEGLAALAVHEPGRAFDQDVMEMTATARHVRHGAVTVAVRQAMTMAGPCEPGDVLGVIAGDFAIVGDDLDGVARQVLDRLLGGGGELVTLVAGAEDGGLATRCAAYVTEKHPYVDAVVYDGGQERYPLLLSVE